MKCKECGSTLRFSGYKIENGKHVDYYCCKRNECPKKREQIPYQEE